MNDQSQSLIEKMIHELMQQRDELKVRLHLGTQEVRDQWDKVEDKLFQLKKKYEPVQTAAEDTAENVWKRCVCWRARSGWVRSDSQGTLNRPRDRPAQLAMTDSLIIH